MKTYADQIADLENTRGMKMARLDEIARKAADEGRDFDVSEEEEFDTLRAEVKKLESSHQRYTELMKMQAATAQPVDHAGHVKSVDSKINVGPMIITKKSDPDDKFEGQAFTRIVIAKALARETGVSPIRIAEQRWGKSHPNLVEYIKADVAGLGSGSGEAGAELVVDAPYMGDFINFLYGQTVYNQLNLREVPANITIGQQDGAATGYWVGESKAIPVSKPDFNAVNLGPLKVGAIAVASKEWLRDASWSAEMLLRDSLVQAGAQRIDTTFISATAATAGSTPAGILNNISATTSAGTDGDAVANDLKELLYRFTQAKNASGELVLVMNPALATGMQLMRNALDQYEFPNVSRAGGSVLGYPVITGDNVNANYLVMLKPSDIYKIGAGSIDVSMSDTATIEMANNPGQDTDTPTAPTGKAVSMFQTESVAFKVVMPINFARRRESAVAWISDADYGGAIST